MLGIAQDGQEDNVATKSKRKVTFDAKRAAVLESKGVRVDTIDPRQVAIGLDGYEDGGANCTLCDHDIKWLYVLHLGLTDGRVVTFTPVGSSCIGTWAESLPVSEAQAAIVAALKVAEEEAEAIKARIRGFNAQAQQGHITEGERDALVRFVSAPKRIRENEFLGDVASKVERFKGWASDRQRDAWLGALDREFRKLGRPGLPAASRFSPEDADLIDRAAKILGDEALLARLNEVEQGALKDIHGKVVQFGSFISPKQKGFFASIIKRAEGSGRAKPVQVEAEPNGRPTNHTAALKAAEDYDGEVPF
jgi:hypothetical protein